MLTLKNYISQVMAEAAKTDVKDIKFDLSIMAVDNNVYVVSDSPNRVSFTLTINQNTGVANYAKPN